MSDTLRTLLALGDLDGLVQEVDRLASSDRWDEVLALREACLAATEETGRQLWGPARYAAYRTALDGPAPVAASMLEPGVVRFGLGPLTEVVAQRHTFHELAPHLDTTLCPIVAQERVLRGEDLRDDPRARGEEDDPPLVLQPFEPDYIIPEYRAAERLDGAVPELEGPRDTWRPLDCGTAVRTAAIERDVLPPQGPAQSLKRALEDVVAPWAAQSDGALRVAAVRGSITDACCAVLDGAERAEPGAATVVSQDLEIATMLRLLAFAGASGGVHGRRRGGAAGRALAWWVARCATGLDGAGTLDPEELEFRLEDLERRVFRVPGEAAWRLELAIGSARSTTDGGSGGEGWAVAVAAFDRSEPSRAEQDPEPGEVRDDVLGGPTDPAPW